VIQHSQIFQFGNYLQQLVNNEIENKESESLVALIRAAKYHNRWFTEEVVASRIISIAIFIQSEKFETLFKSIKDNGLKKTIGFISQENIPLEELINIIYLELSGYSVIYKVGEHNDKLLPYILGLFFKFAKSKPNVMFFETNLPDTDSIIISQRKEPSNALLEYSKNKNAIFDIRQQSAAIINGNENQEELELLANDIFSFFGQGSGNIRKVYIPFNYDIRRIFPFFESWSIVLNHNSYANNYQYHQSVYLMNRIEHLDNGFLLVKEDKGPRAPIGILYYEFYNTDTELQQKLAEHNFYSIYRSVPKNLNEKAFGESANQNLIPSELIKKYYS
jgi:hypothetical protein